LKPLFGIWFSLPLFLTLPIWMTVVSPVFANGDHSDQHPHGEQSFNPLAFGLVSGGLVVVAYFMYRIFSGNKKNRDTEKEG